MAADLLQPPQDQVRLPGGDKQRWRQSAGKAKRRPGARTSGFHHQLCLVTGTDETQCLNIVFPASSGEKLCFTQKFWLYLLFHSTRSSGLK